MTALSYFTTISSTRETRTIFWYVKDFNNYICNGKLSYELSVYLNGVFGYPKTKSECTENILKINPGCKAVFIGDAQSDMKTAKTHGLDFIYMSKFTVQSVDQHNLCAKEAVKVISTLEDLI